MAGFTKKAITDTFIGLLNEKRLDRITVKDIVAKCGVSRKTFYYYFDDIYDLLEKYLDEMKQEAVMKIKDTRSFEAELLRLAEFVMNNKKAVCHIYNSVSRDKLEDYLYESTLPVISETITERLKGSTYPKEDIEIISMVCTNAFTSCVLRWIKDGMNADFENTIKRMAALFEKALDSAVKSESENR